MKIETGSTGMAEPAWPEKAAALPVYAMLALTLSLIWFSAAVEVSYESRVLAVFLNTLLVTAASAWGSMLALRGYLASGLHGLLYAGCGLVAMGSSALISSLIVGGAPGPNGAVTVHNLGVFSASLLHLAAALHADRPRPSRPDPDVFKAACTFLGVLAFTGLIWAAAQNDLTPPFYIPGEGTTPVRQLVLTLSVALLCVAAAFLIRPAMQRGSLPLRCYGLGLYLIALGLVNVSIAVPGSILSWMGRLSQGLGHVYLLAAFMIAIRTAVEKGFNVKEAAAEYYLESEGHHRALVDALQAAVISIDSKGRVVLWNPQAEVTTGYRHAEAAGRPLIDLIASEGESREVLRRAIEDRPGICLEVVLRRKNGLEFPAEVLVFATGTGWMKWASLIIRDISDRRRAEDELRKRELRIRQALKVSRSFAFEWNPVTDEVTRSEECGPLLGLQGEEAVHDSGRNFFLRVHPEDRGPFVALLQALTPESPSYNTKYRLAKPDGEVVILNETGLGFFDAERRLSGLTGISADVTDREQAQAEIAYLASFPRLNPNPVAEADLDGKVRFINPAAAELFPDLQQRGKDHPWLRDWNRATKSLGDGSASRIVRELSVDGKWYYQTLHSIPGSGTVRMYGVEITGLKAAEAALRKTHERLAAILESISDGFFSLDRQFRVTFVNESGAKIIGQTRETMLGRVLWDIFPEAVGSDFERVYRTVMTERVTAMVEAFYPPLKAWFEARAYPSDDGISVFFRDITEGKRIEQALQENQADLNWAQAVGRVGSWRMNVQRNELRWSDENHRIFGLAKGTRMTYETFLGAVHPEDRDYVDRKWQAGLRGEPYDIEHRIVVGDTVKWVRERAELEFDAEGQLLGGFGITQDITEHKKADDALRASEARFRLLARTAAQLLATWDPQAHIQDLAGRVMAHLGCHCFFNFLVAEGPPGRLRLNAWAGIPPEEARRIEWLDYGVAVCGCVARDAARIVAEHIPTTPDVRTELVKSYGIKAYACHPLLGINGRVLGTLSFGTRERETFSEEDLELMKAVTDQVAMALVRMQNERDLRSSAEALQEANERLEEKVRRRTQELEETVATLKNEILVRKKVQTQLHQLSRVFMDAADPIIIEDLSGRIVEMNREAEAVYGWGRGELIGRPIDTLFLPERRDMAERLRERCRRGEEIRNWEGVRKGKSGRDIPSLLTAFPLMDESGKVAFVATICKDISARKAMDLQLQKAHRHLRELSRKSLDALEAERRVVARELHDSIGGSLAAIKFGLEEAAEQALSDPIGLAASLRALISHLADTIKETKRISANLRPLSIDDLGLLATIEWYTRQFCQRYENIQVIRQIGVEEQEIPEEFKIVFYRVMQEALTNAAKHSRADTIRIRLEKGASHFEFEVEDNGCGFNAKEILAVRDELSGFGLKSMQERAEICGGILNLHTRPDGGTSVKVTLPFGTAASGF